MKQSVSRATPEKPRESADLLGANTEIGKKLRQYYDGLVTEEVPDRFAQLLAQLEKAETSTEKGNGDSA